MKQWFVKPASGSYRVLSEALNHVESINGTVHTIHRWEEKQYERGQIYDTLTRWDVIYYTESEKQ